MSLLLLVAGGAVATACIQLPYSTDPAPVAERYGFRHHTRCPVWLHSQLTGYQYCSSPKVDLGLPGPRPPAPQDPQKLLAALQAPASGGSASGTASGPTDFDSMRKHGKEKYDAICAACHQASGQGVPGAFPPLAGSGSFYGDPQHHVHIIVHGQNGEITVQGKKFNGAMPAHGYLSDYDIASIATYERSAWGNDDGQVMPSDVAAVR